MGMVLIPVGLYKTTVDNDIHFNQLEKESKARIKYKKYCSHCGKEVAAKDIIKGYEYEKDKYVVIVDSYSNGNPFVFMRDTEDKEKGTRTLESATIWKNTLEIDYPDGTIEIRKASEWYENI